MNLNRYTEKTQEALVQAQELALEYNHSQIDPEHLLLALVQQTDGVVPQVVAKLGLSPLALQRRLEEELQKRPKVYGAAARVGIGPTLQNVLSRAETQAQSMHDEYVSTEHLLMGLSNDKVAGELNYVITRLCLASLCKFRCYVRYNAVIGAKPELYRRRIASYKNEKIKKRGDI